MGLGKKNKSEEKATKEVKAKVAVVPDAVEENDADSGAGPATPAANTDAEAKKSPKEKIVAAMTSTKDRLARLAFAFGHWDANDTDGLGKMLSEAQGWLGSALDFANGLDDGFNPPRKPRSSGGPKAPAMTVAIGDVVSIKLGALKNYLEDGETELPGGNKIQITKMHNETQVRAKFGDGLVTLVKKSHLCPLIK